MIIHPNENDPVFPLLRKVVGYYRIETGNSIHNDDEVDKLKAWLRTEYQIEFTWKDIKDRKHYAGSQYYYYEDIDEIIINDNFYVLLLLKFSDDS